MPPQLPLTDAERQALFAQAEARLLSVSDLARTERAGFEPVELLPANHEQALARLRTMEAEEHAAAQSSLGAMSELIRHLRVEKPDILGDIQAARKRRQGFWARLALTLGLD